jgi:small subunit ribosomal protein S1
MSEEKNLETKDQQPVEEPKVENTTEKVKEKTEVKDTKVEDTKVEDTKVEDTKVEDTKVEDTIAEETAGKEVEEKVETETKVEEPVKETPHDDFDWSLGKKNSLTYSEAEREKYLSDYDAALTSIKEYEIVEGVVTSISDGDVVLDLNYKSNGLIPLSEFRDMPDMRVGDLVKVYVEQKEDERGQLILSRKKAKLLNAWETLVDSHENGTIINGHVISKTKGGLIVDCGGLETFLPGSQIDIKPIIDYDQYVGKTMEFKVVKINEAIKNAVVSHKALIESDLAEQREAIISSLEKGQVLEGVVKNITEFGAFMDLGGVDGLLYITDISWGRINHPSDVLELNQKLQVVVLDFDENKKRISLGLKQIQPHPWDTLSEEVTVGSTVKGKIVNIEDYGAFLEITPGVEGLIHVSEVSWSNQPVNAREFFQLGQEFEAKVVTIDKEDRKMSLSIKQLEEDPWKKIAEKYPVGSKHSGEVKNLTPYGVFVELEEGIGGMVHISDLSWTKRFSHPSEFTKVGDKIDISIMDVDLENRKLSLGHKQLEENPWDTFENVFPVGSYHEAVIIRRDDKGAIVQLPYGLEAFAPGRHLRKDDGSFANADETLTFKVIEFNRDDKRIIVSHRRYLDDIRRDAKESVEKEKVQEQVRIDKNLKTQRSKMEKTTLGELSVFDELKSQFEESEQAEEAPKEPKAAAKKAPAKKADTKADDLKKIEGIGPKIAEKLSEAGIADFKALAEADVDTLKGILEEAGSRYKMHDPTTWPEQAKLAEAGNWDELKTLQDNLKGGK